MVFINHFIVVLSVLLFVGWSNNNGAIATMRRRRLVDSSSGLEGWWVKGLQYYDGCDGDYLPLLWGIPGATSSPTASNPHDDLNATSSHPTPPPPLSTLVGKQVIIGGNAVLDNADYSGPLFVEYCGTVFQCPIIVFNHRKYYLGNFVPASGRWKVFANPRVKLSHDGANYRLNADKFLSFDVYPCQDVRFRATAGSQSKALEFATVDEYEVYAS